MTDITLTDNGQNSIQAPWELAFDPGLMAFYPGHETGFLDVWFQNL
ncbi:MAG TPA: hypothetical protein VH209_07880 [Steroidobacteraceae bacterium]|jgi:hypothetical protein|nr:hypothetical protein [Steroidobacteraceae bacterium]